MSKDRKNTYSFLNQELSKLSKAKKQSNASPKGNSHSNSSAAYSSTSGYRKTEAEKELEYANRKRESDPNIPDRSYGDFYCSICDSHMNSDGMWEAHVTGKRHLKNIKKGDTDSKYEDLDVQSDIKYELRNVKDPIVGLSYIHEIRRREPDVPSFYNCFLCHASIATIPLVVEHVISLKHRQNYVRENDPAEYQLIEATNLRKEHLEPLLREAALKMEQKYGRGEVKVKQEKPKKLLSMKRTLSDDEDDDVSYHRKPVKNIKNDDKNEPRVWKSFDSLKSHDKSEKSFRDRRKESYHSDDDSVKELPYKMPAKRSSNENKSYPKSYEKRLESDDFSRRGDSADRNLWKNNAYNIKNSKSYEYEPRSLRVEEQIKRDHKSGNSLKEHSPQARSHQSESNLLPHEVVKDVKSNSSLDSIDFIQNVLKIPTEIFLKIILIKMEDMSFEGIEELSLLTKVITKGQELLYKKLPPEFQSVLKTRYENAATPPPSSTGLSSVTSTIQSPSSSSGFNIESNKLPNTQNNESDISFIKGILKSVKSANPPTPVSQNVSIQQHTNPYPNTNFYQNMNSALVSETAPTQQHTNPYPNINLYQPSTSVNQQEASSYQNVNNLHQNTPSTYKNNSFAPSQDTSRSLGNYSYGSAQSNLPARIPGLTLTEKENPDFNAYQASYSPAKSYPTQNYLYKY